MLAFANTAMPATTICLSPALANTILLSRRELDPLFRQIAVKGHLKVVSEDVIGVELPDGAYADTSNIELLVDLLVGHFIDQILLVTSRLPEYCSQLALRHILAWANVGSVIPFTKWWTQVL